MTTGAADGLIVVDEICANIHCTVRMALAPCGQRAYEIVPRHTPPNTTLIASLSQDGIGPSLRFEGATDTHPFVAYIEAVQHPLNVVPRERDPTSIAGLTQRTLSTNVNVLKRCPLASVSVTKSILHRSFGLLACGGMTRVALVRLRRHLRRRARPSSRYKR